MHDPAHHHATPDGPLCPHCGYLLRGVRSPVCVECGRERCRRLTFFDRIEFDAFRAAFGLARVPYVCSDPGQGILGMATVIDGVNIRPVIMLAWKNFDAAEAALEEFGLALPVALVDSASPFCPCCGFSLRRGVEDPRCEVCGTRCAWYEEHDEECADLELEP